MKINYILFVGVITLLLTACGGGGGSSSGGSTVITEPEIIEKEIIEKRSGTGTQFRMSGTAIRPQAIDSGFQANGFAQTWDGRLFIGTSGFRSKPTDATATTGWMAKVFRPEVVKEITPLGEAPVFYNQNLTAFTPMRAAGILEVNGAANSGLEDSFLNALAIVPVPAGYASSIENPFRSNRYGAPNVEGAYLTYEMLLITQNYNAPDRPMGRRYVRAILKDPYTINTEVEKIEFYNPQTKKSEPSPFRPFTTVSGESLEGIEPTMTFDGRLLIWQASQNRLMYSYNEVPGALNGWSDPHYISSMHEEEKNTIVNGVHFYLRYPIAAKPLLKANGSSYQYGEVFRGAYPWITLDGSELVYTAAISGIPGVNRTVRGGVSIIGRDTGYLSRHIDGPVNPDRDTSVRLFYSSPGNIPSFWTPYRDQGQHPIPYTTRKNVMPLFGSNTKNYVEVNLEDYLDGNYLVYLHMNEYLNESTGYDLNITPDTSGNFANARLNGAKFPVEAYKSDSSLLPASRGTDSNPLGGLGRAIFFKDGDYLSVSGSNDRLPSLGNELSVEMFIKPTQPFVVGDDAVNLVTKAGSFSLQIVSGNYLQATVYGEKNLVLRSKRSELMLWPGVWSHVAFTFSSRGGKSTIKIYINGRLVTTNETQQFNRINNNRNNIVIGPRESTNMDYSSGYYMALDELKISRIERTPEEITDSAYKADGTIIATEFSSELPIESLLPSWVNKEDLRIPKSNPMTAKAVALGDRLFSDMNLSSTGDLSCESCHDEALALTDGLAKPIGPLGELTRNAPTLINRALSTKQLWDSSADSIERQIPGPLFAENEMAADRAKLYTYLVENYEDDFKDTYNISSLKESNFVAYLTRALASYVRSLFSPDNSFDLDKQIAENNSGYLSETELLGKRLFFGKARCVACHSGSNFTDESLHNTGFFDPSVADRGARGGRFKTPTLRELTKTKPYMHDGSFDDLGAVVTFYNQGGLLGSDGNPVDSDIDPEIRPLELTYDEQQALIRFLEIL